MRVVAGAGQRNGNRIAGSSGRCPISRAAALLSKRKERTMLSHEAFVGAYHAHFTRTPNQRQRLGITEDIGRMPSPDDADRIETVREAESLLRDLPALESAARDFDTRIDLELARLALANEIHLLTLELDGVPEQKRRPRVGDAIGDPLVELMVLDPRPAHE